MVHFFSLTPEVVVVSKAMHITVLVPAKGISNVTSPSLLPHQEHFMHTELGSSALPPRVVFFFLLVYAKASKSFLTGQQETLALQVLALIPAH